MILNLQHINAAFSVAAQLTTDDLPAVTAQGFTTLINNRPDGEGGETQPMNHDIEQAARAVGLNYIYLPVISGSITSEQALAMRHALDTTPGPVLAFCRSGARSAQLYTMSRVALYG